MDPIPEDSVVEGHIELNNNDQPEPGEVEPDVNPLENPLGEKVRVPRKRKRTSKVWEHFDDAPVQRDGRPRSKCKHCGITYVTDTRGGTGNMLNHIKMCPRKTLGDVSQLLLAQSNGCFQMRSSKFDPEVFRELLIVAIIKHDLPFRFVEYEGIRDIFNYISEDLKLPSRNTARTDVLKIFKREKASLQKVINSAPGRICLTSDLWTSVATDGYLTLTAHFVDEQWKLQKRIMNFCLMPPPHTGSALSEKILKLLRDWKIEKRLFSMTLDNASSNVLFIDLLRNQLNDIGGLINHGDFLHVRCCAHILNLIVQDGLKEIDGSVIKIRESVKYLKVSPSRKYKFYDCVAQVSIVGRRGLRQDVPTRWNSTYTMLDSALFYRRALNYLNLADTNYRHCPSTEEWDKVEKITKFLGLFHSVTLLFSGTLYPTANLFFPEVFIIQHSLKEALNGPDEFLHKMASKMIEKFDKYWSEYSLILAIAVILDPRYKLEFVNWAYNLLHGNNSPEFQRVNNALLSLFDSYLHNSSHHDMPHGMAESNYVTRSTSLRKDQGSELLKGFDNISKEGGGVKKTEVELYLEEARIDRCIELDILEWWKGEQFRYPVLSQIARDVLSIPVSTVASESAFSIGGRVLDQYRSSLLPETVQALLCTRDWLFGKKVIEKDDVLLEELTEDVFDLDLNSNAANSSHAARPSGHGSTTS